LTSEKISNRSLIRTSRTLTNLAAGSLSASCRYDTVDPSRLLRFVSGKYTPYNGGAYLLVKSSDTPELVCLHEFADWMLLQVSYQHDYSALPQNMPTNCGSQVRTLLLLPGNADH
jgi:hypothetical protein